MLELRAVDGCRFSIAEDAFIRLRRRPSGDWMLETKNDYYKTEIVTHVNGRPLKNKTQDQVNKLVAKYLDENGEHIEDFTTHINEDTI